MEALEKRAALLDVLAQRLDPRRSFARVGEELEQPGLRELCARRRDLRPRAPDARRGQPARAAADGLREGAPLGARRGARALALRRRGLRGRLSWRRPTATTTSCSASRATPTTRRSRRRSAALARQLHPDVSTEPDAEVRFREVTEAYEVLSNSETRALYDRYGHAGLRSGGFQPTNFDLGGLGDLFSAFFGDDVFGGGGGRRGAGPTSVRRSRSSSARRRPARRCRCRSRSPSRVRRAAATASSRARSPFHCARCGGTRPAAAGDAQRPRRVRAHAGLPGLRRPRGDRRASVSRLRRRRCDRRAARARGRHPRRHPRRPAHPALRRGPRGRSGRASGRRLRPRPRQARTRASCARATTSTRRST